MGNRRALFYQGSVAKERYLSNRDLQEFNRVATKGKVKRVGKREYPSIFNSAIGIGEEYNRRIKE
jgi:hypothetical protein